MKILAVNDICVELQENLLLEQISFDLQKGECLCIIGESGSGKTTLLKSLQGVMPFSSGAIQYFVSKSGKELTLRPGQSFLGLPGVSWVMQNPLAALNPFQTAGDAILEGLYKDRLSKAKQQERMFGALEDVELSRDFINRYPNQMSLGQAQRVCIARALVSRPEIILFDEPLSALDAVVQKQIALMMDSIRRKQNLGYIFVTHDLGFAKAYANRILLLRHGRTESFQKSDEFFSRPQTPYGASLIDAAMTLGALEPATELQKIS